MTVPAALATTIFILLMFSIVLGHQWEPWSPVRPDPPEDTPTPPLGTLVIYGAHWECWGGHVPKSAPQTIIRLLFPVIVALLHRVRNSRWGKGSKPFPQTQNISMKMPSKHPIIVSFFRHRPRGEGAGLIPPLQQYFVQNLF